MSGREEGFISGSFSHKRYPHITEVLAAMEDVGITDESKLVAGICNAPSLFYSYGIFCSDEKFTKHNCSIMAQYLEYKFGLHHFHPCLRHIKRVLNTYLGSEFREPEYVASFITAFAEFLSKFNQLCITETGHAFKHE